jgi:polyphosphate kinase
MYTDLSFFTSKPDYTYDLVQLFHFLTGCSLNRSFKKLIVAPLSLKERFLELIQNEAKHARTGAPARIIAKMNSLQDPEIIEALYEASAAGVPIDLLVRGVCCLRPGVPGISDNIRVISVVGRFLEHSRVFFFQNGAREPGDGLFFIGSADWMVRNLDYRVEAVAPIEGPMQRALLWELLQGIINEQRQAWDLRPNGRYEQRRPQSADDLGLHERLLRKHGNFMASAPSPASAPNGSNGRGSLNRGIL